MPAWHRVIDVSIQQASIEEAGHRFFAQERQRHPEDVGERLAFFVGLKATTPCGVPKSDNTLRRPQMIDPTLF
jgi:hypothetical protein